MGNEKGVSSQVPESRKIRKPIIEKKRRARINESLDTLKKILLESNPDRSNQKNVKLEKADILEMTVQYLRHLKPNTGVKTINQCSENEVVQICPADSSTNDRKMNSFPKPVTAPDFVRSRYSPYVMSKIMYGNLNTITTTKYNSGGVVYMAPSLMCASNQGFYGRQFVRQPDRNPMENVWRPW